MLGAEAGGGGLSGLEGDREGSHPQDLSGLKPLASG